VLALALPRKQVARATTTEEEGAAATAVAEVKEGASATNVAEE
jgi:hypothetical protein